MSAASAAIAKVEPRRLSFAGVWSLVKAFATSLLQGKTAAEMEEAFARLLRAASQRKVPNRAQERSYPREVLPRGGKFPTRKRKQQTVPA